MTSLNFSILFTPRPPESELDFRNEIAVGGAQPFTVFISVFLPLEGLKLVVEKVTVMQAKKLVVLAV